MRRRRTLVVGAGTCAAALALAGLTALSPAASGTLSPAASSAVVAEGDITVEAGFGLETDPPDDIGRDAVIANTLVNVQPGDVITMTATGLAGGDGTGNNQTPNGSGPTQTWGGDFPALSSPASLYSLIGTIDSEDDILSGNGDTWFPVGTSRTVTANRSGVLRFVFLDELYLEDEGSDWVDSYLNNTGSFGVHYAIERSDGGSSSPPPSPPPPPGSGSSPAGYVSTTCAAGGQCVVMPPDGEDDRFRVKATDTFPTTRGSARGSARTAAATKLTLFAQLDGGRAPNCKGYRERSDDWVKFGFTRPAAGSTWAKWIKVTGLHEGTKKRALQQAKAHQICFVAPYRFTLREGFARSVVNGEYVGILPDCRSLPPNRARPCIGTRTAVRGDNGRWVLRITFRVPPSSKDPRARH